MNMTLLFFKTALKPVALLLLLFASGVVAAQSCKTDIPATTSHLVDNFNGTISDPKTGLIWKKCSEGQSYISSTNSCNNAAATRYTWAEALQQAQGVNTGLGGEALGQNDWRVPNIKELVSIVERSCSEPAINKHVFFVTLSSEGYWSSSLYAIITINQVWVVGFRQGATNTVYKNYSKHVRLVRSAQ